MSSLDRRLVRVSVEIDGQFKVYDQAFDITASGKKTSNPLQNECTVTISNLDRQTRNYLLTETSPFNKNKTPKRMIVEAGRMSTGMTELFYGEITNATPSQPPDIGLTLKAQTGQFAKTKVIARQGLPQQSLSSLAQLVAQDIGVALDFQATDKQIANYSFSGSALRQVDALGLAGGVDAYVDDRVLVVKDRSKPLTNRIRQINQNTGMIGIPEITERGAKVQFLLDVNVVLGGTLDLESELNPAVNGQYTVYALNFDVSSRRQEFYYTAEGTRRQ